ncbi:benzoate/H(+) symporter BenE family transporter [Aureimonas psammosilenae]|uniref:benzoate/H(+) symporter BenE family transporter n=1 Tax=Aureimonas psammosilenae TaxID=2495496 RepID=UPI00126050FB|nr:benzoate/H(+) symporter BenE family transporter [Aureimonas psammosilenae]
MRASPPLPAVSAGLLAAFIGFTSSFSVVLQGLVGVGASQAEAASGLMALSVAMGLCGVYLSVRTRMPISVAWSTPGAALLAGAGLPQGGFSTAVGAFLVAALLVVLAGAVRPLGRLIAAIPASIANAMLAGIIFALCLAPVRAIAAEPIAGLAILLAWMVVGRIRRLLAVPAAALVAIAAILLTKGAPMASAALLPHPVFVMPSFDWQATIGIALPLFLVTMASQNIPGLAILKINGFQPPAGLAFMTTGLFSALAVPFGGHAVNLAAITAAICAGEEAGPDRAERWWAGVVSGFAYVVFGLLAGIVTAFASLSPLLIQAAAGLALVGALSASLHAATSVAEERNAAALTFLTTASGIAFLGISAPFWGLAAGTAMLLLERFRRMPAVAAPKSVEPVLKTEPQPVPGSI